MLSQVYYFVNDWQAKMNRVPAGFKESNGSQRVKYLHPVLILIEIRVLVTKKVLKNVYFLALSKNVSSPCK